MSIDESTGDSEEYVVLENNGENSLDVRVVNDRSRFFEFLQCRISDIDSD